MMLKADAAHCVGHRQQKIIMVELARSEQLGSLCDEAAVRCELFGLDHQIFGGIGDDV